MPAYLGRTLLFKTKNIVTCGYQNQALKEKNRGTQRESSDTPFSLKKQNGLSKDQESKSTRKLTRYIPEMNNWVTGDKSLKSVLKYIKTDENKPTVLLILFMRKSTVLIEKKDNSLKQLFQK